MRNIVKVLRGIVSTWLIISSVLSSPAFSAEQVQNTMVKVDGIYYFGYEGLDLEKLKKGFKLKVGDEVDQMSFLQNAPDSYFKNVKDETGKPVTDAALVNIGLGKHIVFLGLPGKSNTDEPVYRTIGDKRVQVPAEIEKAYNEHMEELPRYLQTKDPASLKRMNDSTERIKVESQSKRAELRKCLLESNNLMDRTVAAYALGLVAEEQADFDAVTQGAKDPHSLVRNNSTRELGELLHEKPELVSMIKDDALEVYADMINSRTWTDRNKSIHIMICLTKRRDPRAIALLKKKSMASLKEMALWPPGYEEPALTLLGRVGGLPDEKIEKLIEKKDSAAILDACK